MKFAAQDSLVWALFLLQGAAKTNVKAAALNIIVLAFCLTLSQREFVTLLLDDKTYLGILAAIGQKAFGHPSAQNVF